MKKLIQNKLFLLLVVIHLILVALTLNGNINFFFNDAVLRKGKGADFFAIYQAGDNIQKGQSVYLDTEGISTPYSYPFRYLPFMGYVVGLIYNIFKPFIAYYIHILIYEFLLFLNIFNIYKLIRNKKVFIISSIPWLIFTPYLLELHMGQWSFLLSVLLFYTIVGIIKNKNWIYSYLLAPLIKPNALILFPILFKSKKFKIILLTTASIIISSLPYFLFFSDDIEIFMKNFQDSFYSHGGNLGLKSLWFLISTKYLSIPFPRGLFLLFMLIGGIVTLTLSFINKDTILNYALWICFFFFIYKDIWEHHYVLLMPIFSLLVYKFKLTFKKIFQKKFIPITLAFVLISFPTIFSQQYLFKDIVVEPDTLHPFYVLTHHSQKILGIVILYSWIGIKIVKRHKTCLNPKLLKLQNLF